jgi:hypothetical protein
MDIVKVSIGLSLDEAGGLSPHVQQNVRSAWIKIIGL